MNKYTTNNKKIAVESGKIFIPSKSGYFVSGQKYKKCKYCSAILKKGMDKRYTSKNYCSLWCLEEDNIYTNRHYCKSCGGITLEILRKGKNTGTGMYPKYCKDCRAVGNHLRRNTQ